VIGLVGSCDWGQSAMVSAEFQNSRACVSTHINKIRGTPGPAPGHRPPSPTHTHNVHTPGGATEGIGTKWQRGARTAPQGRGRLSQRPPVCGAIKKYLWGFAPDGKSQSRTAESVVPSDRSPIPDATPPQHPPAGARVKTPGRARSMIKRYRGRRWGPPVLAVDRGEVFAQPLEVGFEKKKKIALSRSSIDNPALRVDLAIDEEFGGVGGTWRGVVVGVGGEGGGGRRLGPLDSGEGASRTWLDLVPRVLVLMQARSSDGVKSGTCVAMCEPTGRSVGAPPFGSCVEHVSPYGYI